MSKNDCYSEPTYTEANAQGAAGEPVLREYGGPEVLVPRDGSSIGQLEITVKSPTTREGDLLTEIDRLRDRVAWLERQLAKNHTPA